MKFRILLVALAVLMTVLIYVNKGVDSASKNGAVVTILILFGVIFIASYLVDRRMRTAH